MNGPDTVPAAGGVSFAEIVQRRLSRRGLLRAGLVLSAGAAVVPALGVPLARPAAAQGAGAAPRFVPIPPDVTDQVTVSAGYRVQVAVRWGDPLFAGTPAFDLHGQTAALQERQFGFNNDFLAFLPLPLGSDSSTEGLLWANLEYTDGRMMFPGYELGAPTAEQAAIEMAAHGGAVVHLRRLADGSWAVEPASPYNRRTTATTPMRLAGPATGHPLLQTSADPTGTLVLGSLNNCAGGVTPWGTVLTCEENFNTYFGNLAGLDDADPRKADHRRYGIATGASRYRWERYHDRLDVAKEPNEPYRYGWVVEVDPYDPAAPPVKRTALGRVKHEAATCVVAPDGRVVVYTGDDERFDYVYKFVTAGRFDPANRAANRDLLDSGTLYVAKLHDDGSGEWLPLVFGQGPLTAEHGFRSQADVLIRTRQAGDALGATPMDRPEDIETNPVNRKVYVVLTYNERRGVGNDPAADAANPRVDNRWGHILELAEADDDPAATTFRWDIFLLCGDPGDASTYFAGFPKDQVSPVAAPDNIAFDGAGNLWIATDGQPTQLDGWNDGVFAVATTGPQRGQVLQFLSGPVGCELCGPLFTPDNRTFFAAIQHPGEGGDLANPTSVWPDGPDGPARPAVIAITRLDGGVVGQ